MVSGRQKSEAVPRPEPEEKATPALANPDPSALAMTSSAQCRACTNGYGDGCCAYHQSKWQRLLARQEHLNRPRASRLCLSSEYRSPVLSLAGKERKHPCNSTVCTKSWDRPR